VGLKGSICGLCIHCKGVGDSEEEDKSEPKPEQSFIEAHAAFTCT
jgi:hypothetical protein